MAWSFTEQKYINLMSRITAIETTINDALVAMGRLASVNQVHELLVVVQTELEAVSTVVEGLEERIQSIEEEPLS
jgi:hypothetical protein